MAELEKPDAEKPVRGARIPAKPDGTTDLRLTNTSAPTLIRVGDKLGVFTPVAEAGDKETSEENLERIVEVLSERITSLESQNQRLKGELTTLAAASERSADDFATAVGHSIDSLQARLLEGHNPVSRFALRSFDIEASVHVEVTALGTVEYRFPKPEESVDPARLSKIRLSVVPIARDDEQGSWDTSAFTPQAEVGGIRGVSEDHERRLNQSSIYTVSDLLAAGTRARSQVELAAVLGIERTRLAQWLTRAELMTLKGVGGPQAEILHELGISRLEQLARTDPEELAKRYNDAVARSDDRGVKPIEAGQVKAWVSAARAFSGVKRDTLETRRPSS